MRAALLFLLLCFNALGVDYDYADFNGYQGKVTRAQIDKRILLYLIKSEDLKPRYRLTDQALEILDPSDKVEFTLVLGDKTFVEEKTLPPLHQARIAIDPGHLGGKFARTEGRYVDMKPEVIGGKTDIRFDEGTLSVLTARRLAKLLQAEGAKVFLTREKPGQSVYPVPFEGWRETKEFEDVLFTKFSDVTDPEKKAALLAEYRGYSDPVLFFKLYNGRDIQERARVINEFAPDLTVAIHYNAGGGNEDKTGLNLGTDRNFNLVFIPGSYKINELWTREARYHFVRLAVTGDIERAAEISKLLAKALHTKTGVPIVTTGEEKASYLRESCREVFAEYPNTGVYCRNLGLTRWVKGPITYGESLCQDNFKECLILNERTVDIDGYKTSPRVLEVSDAYFAAIKAWFK